MNQTISIRKLPCFLWLIHPTLRLLNNAYYVQEKQLVEKVIASDVSRLDLGAQFA